MHAQFTLPDRPFQAYIFDCDGTLADSMPLHYRAWVHAVRAQGATFDYDLDLFYSLGGMSVARTVEVLNQRFGASLDFAAVEAEKSRFFQQHVHSLEPISEVLAVLRDVAARGLPRAVASGSHRIDLVPTLQAVGAWDLVSVVVAHEDVTHSKPHPEPFLTAAARLGVDPVGCVVFEDSPLGIQAAEAAGMTPVLVRTRRP